MKSVFFLFILMAMGTTAYSQGKENAGVTKPGSRDVACKLTTPELQERKRTVIAELKQLLMEKKETDNGIRYKFDSSDKMLDLISSFIKTERMCCDFFDFTVTVEAETGFMWLELSGPKGTKEFVNEEIGF